MKSNAIAIANYFIDKSQVENKELTLLFLIKLVYLAHGYLLAMMDDGGFDPRFDKVEAWKYGPVIPSVYHTFKYNKTNPIKEKGTVLTFDENNVLIFEEPEITDSGQKIVLDFVWNRYKNYSIEEIIKLTHREDTPWAYCYRVGKNVEIPDEYTSMYYKRMVERLTTS